MSPAFLESILNFPSSPSAPTISAFDDNLADVKDDLDALSSPPFRFRHLSDHSPSIDSPSREGNVPGQRQQRPQSEADVSTDSNSSNYPVTPPNRAFCKLVCEFLSKEPNDGSAEEERKFLRDILTTYEDVSSPVYSGPTQEVTIFLCPHASADISLGCRM